MANGTMDSKERVAELEQLILNQEAGLAKILQEGIEYRAPSGQKVLKVVEYCSCLDYKLHLSCNIVELAKLRGDRNSYIEAAKEMKKIADSNILRPEDYILTSAMLRLDILLNPPDNTLARKCQSIGYLLEATGEIINLTQRASKKDDLVNILAIINKKIAVHYSSLVQSTSIFDISLQELIDTGSKIIDFNPYHLVVRLSLAEVYRRLEKFGEIKKLLEPWEDKLEAGIGMCFMTAENEKQSIHTMYNLLLGYAHRVAGEFEMDMQRMQRILEIHPNSAEAYSELGAVAFEQGNLEETIRCTEKAIALVDRDEFVVNPAEHKSSDLVHLACAFIEKKEYTSAESRLLESIEIFPENVSAYRYLAQIAHIKNLDEEAIDFALHGLSLEAQSITEVKDQKTTYQLLRSILSKKPLTEIVNIMHEHLEGKPASIKSACILLDLLEFTKDQAGYGEVLSQISDLIINDPLIERHFKDISPKTLNPVKVVVGNLVTEQVIVLKGADDQSEDAQRRLQKDYALTNLAWQLADNPKEEMSVKAISYLRNVSGRQYSMAKHARQPNLLEFLSEEKNPKEIAKAHMRSLANMAFFQAAMTDKLEEDSQGHYLGINDGRNSFRIKLEAYDHMEDFLKRAVPTHPTDKYRRLCQTGPYIPGQDLYLDHFVDEVGQFVEDNFVGETLLVITGDEHNGNFLKNGAMLDWEYACLGNPMRAYTMKVLDPVSAWFSGHDHLKFYLKQLQKSLDKFEFEVSTKDFDYFTNPYTVFLSLRLLSTNLAKGFTEGVDYCVNAFRQVVDAKAPLAKAFEEWRMHDGRIK